MFLFTAITWSSGLHKRSQNERCNESSKDVTDHLCNKSCQNTRQIDLLQLLTEARFLVYNTWKGPLNATLMNIYLSQLCFTLLSHRLSRNRVASYSHRAYTHLLAHIFFHVCQSFNGQYSGRSVKERKKLERGWRQKQRKKSNSACTVTKYIIFN